MNTALWIGQIVLAFIFLVSGSMKSTQSERWLVTHGQTGVEGLPKGLIKFIGTTEILETFGLILPWVLGTARVLTPIAALGCCLTMVLAAPIHYKRKEPGNVATNIAIFLVAAFVAYGRFADL